MIGIDVGFGDVKAVYLKNNEIEYLKIPTAVKYAGANSAGIKEDGIYSFQGKDYIVGEHARFGAFSTRSYDFLKRYSGLFVFHVLKTLGIEDGKVGIGLPLNWYSKKDDFFKELSATVVNGELLRLDPKLFPQAVGVLLDYRYNIKGELKTDTDKDGIVLDIGYNTVDVLCFEKGSAVRSDAATIEKFGISRIVVELSDIIQKNYSFQLSEQETKEVFISGKMKLYGDEKDMSETVRSLIEKYFEELIHTIESRWESRLQRSEIMLLAGGGAVTLKEYMPSSLSKIIAVPVRPEFSNARGYLKGLIQSERK